MKTTEYILKRIREEGVKHVFLVTGGAIVPMVDAFDKNTNLEYICTTQEQGAAMAAEAYSRITENLGVAMATSGPGATNLITGIGCAYFDSIPTIYITGQVPTFQLRKASNARQVGFQETDIVPMVKPITKYAKLIDNPHTVRYELEKAIHIARSGRPGPVLLDFPMDVQMSNIDPESSGGYTPQKVTRDYRDLDRKIDETIELINHSQRPILILGAGVRLGHETKRVRSLVERLDIPTVLTWGAMDILPYTHPLFVEGFGVTSNRAGNFAVQNSDLVVSLGSRLDTRQVGGKAKTFARGAKKVILDIDAEELYKEQGVKADIAINDSIKDFLEIIEDKMGKVKTKCSADWRSRIEDWKKRYPICPPEYFNQKEKVNPYAFMHILSEESKEGDIVITDAGGNLTWTMQGFKVKEGQRLFSAFGNSPMAYSLPASIGASFASDKGPVTCIIGDGGLKMNINELETIVKHNLPIKVFLVNNHEYGIIKQFQDILCESRYKATDSQGGLGDPDLLKIAEAYGMTTSQIAESRNIRAGVRRVLDYNGPILCSVELRPGEKIVPKLEFGNPIEDPSPLLDREEFIKNMLVKPLDGENKTEEH